MVINLKSKTNLGGFYIQFEGSTNLEKPGWRGLSHLMEHLICKNFSDIRDDLLRDGIKWNARTSSNDIVFYFCGIHNKLEKKKNYILDKILDFNIKKEDFESEKKIILQEYDETFSSQENYHLLNLKRKLFNNYGAIGLRQDLEGMRFLDCINFFELQYQSPKKIINVTPQSKFSTDIDFSINKINKKVEMGPHNDVILEEKRNFGKLESIYFISNILESDFAVTRFINSMLSTGLSSPLYSQLREKNSLVYHINCKESRFNKQSSIFIETQTNRSNVELVIDKIGDVLENPKKWMTEYRFSTIKEKTINDLEKERIMRWINVDDWLEPEEFLVKNIINTITYDQVMEVYDKYYNLENFYISKSHKEL